MKYIKGINTRCPRLHQVLQAYFQQKRDHFRTALFCKISNYYEITQEILYFFTFSLQFLTSYISPLTSYLLTNSLPAREGLGVGLISLTFYSFLSSYEVYGYTESRQ